MKKDKKKVKKNTRQSESPVDDSLMSSSYINITKSTDNEYTIQHKYRYHKALLLHAAALLILFVITFVFTYCYLQKFMETGSIFKIFAMGHGDPNYYVLGNLLFFVGVTMLLPMLNIHLILSFVLHSSRPLYTTIIIYNNIHINITKKILGVTYRQNNIDFTKDAPMFYNWVRTLSFLQCTDYRDLKKISINDWGYELLIHDQSGNLLLSIDDLSCESMMKIRIALQSELNLKKNNMMNTNIKKSYYGVLFHKCEDLFLKCYACLIAAAVIIDTIVFHSNCDILKAIFTNS